MQLAKPLKRNPRDIATALIAALPASPYVAKAEVAGAGFINFFLKPEAHQARGRGAYPGARRRLWL